MRVGRPNWIEVEARWREALYARMPSYLPSALGMTLKATLSDYLPRASLVVYRIIQRSGGIRRHEHW